jgi:phosphatidate cytidylyltransferase
MRRIATAAILIPLVTYVAGWGHRYLFLAVLATVAVLCFREYCTIVARHNIDPPGPAGYAAGLVLLVIPLPQADVRLLLVVALAALALALRSKDLARGLPRAAALLLGVMYVFGTWRMGAELRAINPYWLLFALVLNWIGDTAAYYVGRRFGRHKLAPRLSPAKSWEGSLASATASAVFGLFYLGWLMPEVPVALSLALAVAGNVAGQLGDLVESAMKRGAGLKDSGNLLPGHGGWLDRVDSTMFSMPAVYLLLTFFDTVGIYRR